MFGASTGGKHDQAKENCSHNGLDSALILALFEVSSNLFGGAGCLSAMLIGGFHFLSSGLDMDSTSDNSSGTLPKRASVETLK